MSFFFLSTCFFDSPFLIALGGASLFCFDLDMVISFVRGMWPHPFSSNNCLFSVFIIFKGFFIIIEIHYKKILHMIFKLLFNSSWFLNKILSFYENVNNFFKYLMCQIKLLINIQWKWSLCSLNSLMNFLHDFIIFINFPFNGVQHI